MQDNDVYAYPEHNGINFYYDCNEVIQLCTSYLFKLKKFFSFERVFAIIKGVLVRESHKKILILCCIWAISLAAAGPQLYEYSIYMKFEAEENKTEKSCGSHGIAVNIF